MRNQRHDTVPPLDAKTIEYMERLFPERCPDPKDSEREIWMKAGERRAAIRLRNLLNRQES